MHEEASQIRPPEASATPASGLVVLVERALKQLNEREQQILRMRFGIGVPMRNVSEVSQCFGVSCARVRQIELRALGGLRTNALREAASSDAQLYAGSGIRTRVLTAVAGPLRERCGDS